MLCDRIAGQSGGKWPVVVHFDPHLDPAVFGFGQPLADRRSQSDSFTPESAFMSASNIVHRKKKKQVPNQRYRSRIPLKGGVGGWQVARQHPKPLLCEKHAEPRGSLPFRCRPQYN